MVVLSAAAGGAFHCLKAAGADDVLQKSTSEESLHRTGREVHYPPVVDLLDPYILLVHQGMVETVFVDDLKERGVDVERNTAFVDYEHAPQKVRPLHITCRQNVDQSNKTYGTRVLVGCDGAHSQVRKTIPDSTPVGASSDAVWGVLDGVLDTDFPDIWSKVVVHSEQLGSILMIPRERNLTRLYIELKADAKDSSPREDLTQSYVQKRAQEIMAPYSVSWKSVGKFAPGPEANHTAHVMQNGLGGTRLASASRPSLPTLSSESL